MAQTAHWGGIGCFLMLHTSPFHGFKILPRDVHEYFIGFIIL